MKRVGILFVLMLFLLSGFVVAGEYKIDKSVSKVKWEGKKVAGKHYGFIDFKDGTFLVDDGVIKEGTVSVDMTTMVCEDLKDESWNKKLITHLHSDDFFSVDKYTTSELKIVEVKKESANTYILKGDLTIKGITKPIEFKADITMNGENLMASGVITIDRTHYGIRYGSGSFFSNLGDRTIYDDFTLDFELVAKP